MSRLSERCLTDFYFGHLHLWKQEEILQRCKKSMNPHSIWGHSASLQPGYTRSDYLFIHPACLNGCWLTCFTLSPLQTSPHNALIIWSICFHFTSLMRVTQMIVWKPLYRPTCTTLGRNVVVCGRILKSWVDSDVSFWAGELAQEEDSHNAPRLSHNQASTSWGESLSGGNNGVFTKMVSGLSDDILVCWYQNNVVLKSP